MAVEIGCRSSWKQRHNICSSHSDSAPTQYMNHGNGSQYSEQKVANNAVGSNTHTNEAFMTREVHLPSLQGDKSR